MNRATTIVLTLTSILAAAAVTVLIAGAQLPHDERGTQFQQLVGGLRLGPAVDLKHCEASFDPRLCPHCSYDVSPLPAGMIFCPHHGVGLP